MAIGVYFPATRNTAEQYNKVLDGLEAAGQGKPDGRLYHASFWAGENLHVFDVWENQEKFQAFGAVLQPLLTDAGIEIPEPQISEIYRLIQG